MPQFDIFSFFSQLFWVFLFFSFSFIGFTYHLLPALAITLKIRNKKLTSPNSSSDQDKTNKISLLLPLQNIYPKLFNLKFSYLTNNDLQLPLKHWNTNSWSQIQTLILSKFGYIFFSKKMTKIFYAFIIWRIVKLKLKQKKLY